MRALLVYNPNATTTTPAVLDVITSALAGELKLEVEATKRRDHAGFLAAGAAHEGFEAVFVLGGDGTVNEIVQGIAGSHVRLGIIPGGSTNVWARTLGLSNDPVEATGALLRRVRAGDARVVNLGEANGRLFAFNAGYGFDAEVVRLVEQRYRLKRTVRQASFLYCGLVAYLTRYDRRAAITVEVDGGVAPVTLRTAVCCNSAPYTFLGRMPAQLCPHANLDEGLDLLGLTGMSLPRMARLIRTTLTTRNWSAREDRTHHRRWSARAARTVDDLSFTRLWHDRAAFTLTSERPLPLQVDGDFIGEAQRVELRSAERALTVLA